MDDQNKTKQQLIEELTKLRQRVADSPAFQQDVLRVVFFALVYFIAQQIAFQDSATASVKYSLLGR